jgi:CRISPR-associated protein Cmr1
VRGHLRFWWRALYSHRYQSAEELYARETELWGRAATEKGGRSAVGIRINIEKTGRIDDSDIRQQGEGAYALWPARAEKKQGQVTKLPAQRRRPGTQFELNIVAPVGLAGEIRNVVRAWLLFGGYGSRTRRGLGSFSTLGDSSAWLPSRPTREAIKNLFGLDIFALPGKAHQDVPWLGGASLHVGKVERDAVRAWTTALEWLKEFRQGHADDPGKRAREPDPTGRTQRPSISNWSEADKVRHLERKTNGHRPRHNSTPVWPRAGFGLPIRGEFQKDARNGGHYDEPNRFELHWCSEQTGEHDRLASPLIVKALALADGTFVPCALWLNRAYPNGDVILNGMKNSAAPFDRIVAPGDTPQFSALANKQTLREAFLEWLHAKYQTTVVAP